MSDPAKAMKLLACPFCNGVAIRMKHANGCKQIRCKSCKAATASMFSGQRVCLSRFGDVAIYSLRSDGTIFTSTRFASDRDTENRIVHFKE